MHRRTQGWRPLAALSALLAAVLVLGTMPGTSAVAADPINGLNLNLADGELLRGTKTLVASDSQASAATTIAVDGQTVPVTTKPADIDIVVKVNDYRGAPTNNFKNSFFVNGVKVATPAVNVTGFNDLKVTVPSTAFKAGSNTIQLQVGSSVMPNDPNRNNDDFDARDLRLVFHDGTVAADASIDAATVVRMGDSTGKERTHDWTIDVPAAALTTISSYAWDTTKASTGEHTVKVTSADGTRSRETKVLVDQSADIHTNLTDGQVLSGSRELIASSDAPVTFAVDGKALTTTARPTTTAPLFRFEADGWQASQFKNSVWLNGELVSVPKTGDVSGFRTIDVPVPADKLKAGENVLRIRTGTANDTIDETGNANNDDFSVRDTRLEFAGGLVLRDPAKSGQTLAIRDGLPPDPKTATYYQDYVITVPEWALTEYAATLDTATLTDGDHVITATKKDSPRTATSKVVVDNAGPVVTFASPLDGATVKQSAVKIDVQVTDALAGVDTVELTLDGKAVRNGDSITPDELTDGKHVLKAVAIDNRGNRTEKSITFTTIGNYPLQPTNRTPADKAKDQSATGTRLAVTVADPAGDKLDVDVKWAYRGDFANATGVSAKAGTSTAATPQRGAGSVLTDADRRALASKDGSAFTTDGTGAYPFQQFELAVPNDLAASRYDVTWTGQVPAGQRVALSVWNYETQKWQVVASGNGGSETTLTGRASVADTVRGGKAQVLVQDVAASVISEKDAVFAWVTDTQFYSAREPDTYAKMLQWAIDNRSTWGIGYGVHTGDIVNSVDVAHEWTNASNVHDIWDDKDFPNGVVPGNHDIQNGNYENYREHFGEKRYAGKPWYGGTVDDNVQHYDIVSTPKADYLIMYLDWSLGDDEVAWANKVIKAHPEHNVVIATHQYLTIGGGYVGPGQRIFDEVVVPNKNVDLVLSGHVHGVAYNVKHLEGERVVVEVLFDSQSLPTAGGGWMRTVKFDTDKQTVSNFTHSVLTPGNTWFDPKLDNFTEPMKIEAPTRKVTTDYVGIVAKTNSVVGSQDDVASGSTVSVPAGTLKGDTRYSWYVDVTDKDGYRTSSEVWDFWTGAAPTAPVPTATSVKGVDATSRYGVAARLRATGLPSAATGTVTFTEGKDVRCVAKVSNGRASCPASPKLSVREHKIVARYSGDTKHAASKDSFVLTVRRGDPRLRVNAPYSARRGSSARLTATATYRAAGSVRFFSGGRTLCTARLAKGKAACSARVKLGKGSHKVYGRFGGDTRYLPDTAVDWMRVR